ncbi:LysM peptidoglycan-binding domain-containing protein [Brevibacillus humidisoli]|uniref:stalk domain-containing protein n=1 Tax=Brevibacillus humidisoli TaxID=2895522 RepID=UPI001E368BD6|nr:stalk domain-containing protein [Brevibacillus humidisoli]UFJ42194.1 LysM peptidoglycan-binding domain-containing protein [Brevibacillus humidisoli]
MEQVYKRKRPRLMGRWLGALACCAFLFTVPHAVEAASASPGPVIPLMIDGKGVASDVQPIIRNGRMLVPIRVIAEKGDLAVSFDASSKTVHLKGEQQIQVTVNSRQAWANGNKVQLDAAPTIVSGRTLVPIRFVSEVLGYHVSWDSRSKIARVSTDEFVQKYVIRDGESLWQISRLHNVPIQAIQQLNLLDGDVIRTGQMLLIPRSGSQPYIPASGTGNSYLVQEGDTLAVVAKRHGTTVQAIVSHNRLTDTNLYVGQVLYLPPGASRSSHPLSRQLSEKQLLAEENVFPLGALSRYEPFYDTYGDGRQWNVDDTTDERTHQGIDIMAEKGTPIYSASSGVINRIGWNPYGGWRINITDASGRYRLYYAHMSGYAPGLAVGTRVEAGQLIGFVGNTGYGTIGTSGKFPTHLHFGLYQAATNQTFNPFYYLKYWESRKVW